MHICYQKESCSVRSIFFNNTVAVDLLDDRMGMFYIKGGKLDQPKTEYCDFFVTTKSQ